MNSLFVRPSRLPLVAPSILSADFAHMYEECKSALDAGADLLHLDVMDGHFVPNLTMGPDMCRGLRRAFPDAFLDVHLMVTNPAQYFEPFARAGANHVTFHVEVLPRGGELERASALAERAHGLGMTAGLAINPPTGHETFLTLMGAFDLLLVMSVNPGFSGQAFIAETLAKTRLVRERVRKDQRIQMDGGISTSTAGAAREAGCDVLVAASAVFGIPAERRGDAIAKIRGQDR